MEGGGAGSGSGDQDLCQTDKLQQVSPVQDDRPRNKEDTASQQQQLPAPLQPVHSQCSTPPAFCKTEKEADVKISITKI